MVVPHAPTPEWAIACMKRVADYDDADLLDAVLALLAAVSPDEETNKHAHEAAWAAIEYGYTRTKDCREKARLYVGAA